MAKLLVHESAGIREFEIIDNEVHLGRELDNTLRLPDPSISRHHCVIRQVGGGFEIQDLQSSNGVLINGNRVQASPLKSGDRITLGQVHLTFQDPRQETGSTVAINVQQSRPGPAPGGTVRMSAEELAAIHAGKKPAEPVPKIQLQDQAPRGPVPPPVKLQIPPVVASPPPRFTPAPLPSGSSSPGFLSAFLPSIPDLAQPTGERGDFFTRLVAAFLDGLPFVALYIGAFYLAYALPSVGFLLLPLVGLAGMAYGFLFLPYCESRYGASFGKKAMRLRVVPEDDPRGRMDFGTALLRRLGHILNFTIGYLLVFGGERKHVGDMISGSVCIKVDR